MKSLSRLVKRDAAWGLGAALASFLVYLTTLAPSIGPEDAGEIAAAVHGLGIVHPTGYPLYSLLGKAFTLVALTTAGLLRVVTALNLLGALTSAAAVFVAYRLFLTLLGGDAFGRDGRRSRGRATPDAKDAAAETATRLAAVTGALVLAFSRVFWGNAVVVEVYALHALLMGLATWFFLAAIRLRERGPGGTDGARTASGRGEAFWLLFAYTLGLSFANHMMTVLLAPAFLWAFFRTHGGGRAAWIRIARAVPVFLLALTLYLYLPLRAALRPLMNWGNPADAASFWNHVTGAQYRAVMFSSGEVAGAKTAAFFAALPGTFGYLPLASALAGLVWLWRRDRNAALFSLLIFAAGLVYAVNYDFDDPNFYLNPHVMIALWAGAGLAALATSAARFTRSAGTSPLIGAVRIPVFASVLVIAFPLAVNHQRVSARGDHVLEDQARAILEGFAPGAVAVSGGNVDFSFPAWYLQYVEGVRPDVTVMDYSLLGVRWHYEQIFTLRPRQARRSDDRMNALVAGYVNDPVLARHGLSPAFADEAYTARVQAFLVSAFLRAWFAEAPLYIVGLVPREVYGDLYDIPEGLATRLAVALPADWSPRTVPHRAFPDDEGRAGMRTRRHFETARAVYADAYANQAMYAYLVTENRPEAAALARKALAVRPGHPLAAELLARLRREETVP